MQLKWPGPQETHSSRGVPAHQRLLTEATVKNASIPSLSGPALYISLSANSVTNSAPSFGQNLLFLCQYLYPCPTLMSSLQQDKLKLKVVQRRAA